LADISKKGAKNTQKRSKSEAHKPGHAEKPEKSPSGQEGTQPSKPWAATEQNLKARTRRENKKKKTARQDAKKDPRQLKSGRSARAKRKKNGKEIQNQKTKKEERQNRKKRNRKKKAAHRVPEKTGPRAGEEESSSLF